jgi:hypothetical protein
MRKEPLHVCLSVSLVRVQVSVFPEIDPDDWGALNKCDSVHKCVIFVVSLGDYQLLILGQTQPDPAWEDTRENCLSQGLS